MTRIAHSHFLWQDLSTSIKIFVLVILAFIGIGHYRGLVFHKHILFQIVHHIVRKQLNIFCCFIFHFCSEQLLNTLTSITCRSSGSSIVNFITPVPCSLCLHVRTWTFIELEPRMAKLALQLIKIMIHGIINFCYLNI